MNIRYEVSNLLNVQSGIIVHGCNAQGVMGAGVAAAIKATYPECFARYKTEFDQRDALYRALNKPNITDHECMTINELLDMHNEAHVGGVIWWHADNSDLSIANAITQDGFGLRRDTDYNAVDAVFEKIFNYIYPANGEDTIHIPLIGSGIGGGDWRVIESIILDRAANHTQRKEDGMLSPLPKVVVHCLTVNDIPAWRYDELEHGQVAV